MKLTIERYYCQGWSYQKFIKTAQCSVL